MTPGEISDFLEQVSPPLLGVVATLRASGAPHAVPVWYRWDGHAIIIWTGHDRGWVRNLRRDQRIAFTAQQAQPPYGAVIIHGHANITGATDAAILSIARRYLPEHECDAYIASFAQLRTIVRIQPQSVQAWSRGY